MEPVEASLELIHLGICKISYNKDGFMQIEMGGNMILDIELTEKYKDYFNNSRTVDVYIKARNDGQ